MQVKARPGFAGMGGAWMGEVRQAWPGPAGPGGRGTAVQARVTGRIVQFPAHNAREIESYLAAVREAGLVAEDVEIRKADLEDVFLEVMADKTVSTAAAAEVTA